ncbi:DPP IV N-terminal domain-containing protein [Streptomyces katrae]|uniref:DPP IV N-terminal domain-containing protein n=1 Tax=Streptomyces katrae TaxID=68223 RepID=UPI000B21998F|nr:DPP IV N-terminal domain-containing protein [Streptomyces katrae]
MDDFLRLSASTGRFTYGAPRAFSFGDDGRLLWFLRSTGPTDAFDSLWVLDTATGAETRLADPRELSPEPGTLPAAERRLRERIRLVAAGIGSYALSGDGRSAVFPLYGRLYRVGYEGTPTVAPEELPAAGPALDPRLNADGSRTAYVTDDALYTHPGGRVSPADGARWGIAEFAAAEELDRGRGHWWSPDGETLLAARVDESALQRRHFADPAHPELPAEDFAYPEAGGPNAEVQLWVLGPGGGRVRLDWDAVTYPYVSDADWESETEILLTVQDRLQQCVLLLSADPATGRTREPTGSGGPYAPPTGASSSPPTWPRGCRTRWSRCCSGSPSTPSPPRWCCPAATSPAGGCPSSWTATAAPASRTCPPSRAAGSTASGGPTGASRW